MGRDMTDINMHCVKCGEWVEVLDEFGRCRVCRKAEIEESE